jgi:hypothetical protein
VLSARISVVCSGAVPRPSEEPDGTHTNSLIKAQKESLGIWDRRRMGTGWLPLCKKCHWASSPYCASCLGYLQDLAFTLPNPGELGFVTKQNSRLKLHPSACCQVPCCPKGIGQEKKENRTKKLKRDQGLQEWAGATETYIAWSWLCWAEHQAEHFWPSLDRPHGSDGQSTLIWQLSFAYGDISNMIASVTSSLHPRRSPRGCWNSRAEHLLQYDLCHGRV